MNIVSLWLYLLGASSAVAIYILVPDKLDRYFYGKTDGGFYHTNQRDLFYSTGLPCIGIVVTSSIALLTTDNSYHEAFWGALIMGTFFTLVWIHETITITEEEEGLGE